MRVDWPAHYLDGKNAIQQPAVARLMQSGLEIVLGSGTTLWWPYREIHQTQGFYEGEQVRLERGSPIPAALVISDHTFLTALHQRGPELAGKFHNPARRSMRIRLTVYAAIAAIGLSVGFYFWGIPALAAMVAPHVPISWEEHLGRQALMQLAPKALHCKDDERHQAIKAILAALLTTVPEQPYTFRVIVVDQPQVNAFAAPGGYIVIFRGLLEKSETPEELAGVMAHEIQHVLLRHSTQRILERTSTSILIAAMTGDVSGTAANGLEAANILGMMRYSRQDEAEADLEGMNMVLGAGVNPGGMISFFEMLRDEGLEIPGFLKYISSHPPTEERILTLKKLALHSSRSSTPLLPDQDWQHIRAICESEQRSG